MRCNFKGCRGEHERKLVSQVFSRAGKSLVIKDIPAEVCSLCGDTILDPDTAEQLEEILEQQGKPQELIPVYLFPVRTKP